MDSHITGVKSDGLACSLTIGVVGMCGGPASAEGLGLIESLLP